MPRIHDVTTDTTDPPAFVDLLAHRRGAWNPAEYSASQAVAQRAAWPQIGPLDTPAARPAVHAAARQAMQGAGWRVVADDPDTGRLEATATTPWLRFKDDVVVRLRDRPGGGTRVDVRSASRIGRNDFGANARRVLAFLERVRGALGTAR